MSSSQRAILRICLTYAIAATVYILISDRMLLVVTNELNDVILIGIFKGLTFVLITTGLLFLTMRREFKAREAVEQDLVESNQRLERALQALESTQQQLIQQERLAALGQMAAGIAHDFKNVLTPINLYTELVLTDPSLSASSHMRLERLLEEAQIGAQLTQQILDFSRTGSLELEIIDMGTFLIHFIDQAEPILPDSIEVICEAEERKHHVRADRHAMHRCLMNLTFNALDAMPDGGKLRFFVTQELIDARKQASTDDLSAGDWIRLDVIDNGIGINAENMSHLFEPFFTTKRAGQGTGLGLAQVYGVIRRHGGDIKAQSSPGVETRFSLYLPEASSPIAQRLDMNEAKIDPA